MILHKCDRCGKEMPPERSFTIEIEPPSVFRYCSDLAIYYAGPMHFCEDCMGKINECIDELGRRK